jgi:DNA (cytosine-5)-methyltransferase 1
VKVLDLFCGAGGLGFGFEMTGVFEVVAGIDIYQPALNSFYTNHNCPKQFATKYSVPTDLSSDKVRRQIIEDFREVDLVIGGPPCQGFSVAGRRLDDFLLDERNHQVFNFLDVVKGISPRAFVMENVRGITTTGQKDKNSIINQLVKRFESLGYKAKWKVLHAEDYFVPQKRRRMVLVGIRREFSDFMFPEPQCGQGDDLFSTTRPYTTVREAISDLPAPNDGNFQKYRKRATNWYQELMRELSDGVQAHSVTKHSPEFVKKLEEQAWGEKLYPNWNHSWVKFHPDFAAPTIKENHRAPGVHYERPMCISPRECARLQSMPDRFELSGTKTERLIQVGNAVPPLLGAAIATSLANVFNVKGVNRFGVSHHLQRMSASRR